MFYICLDNVQNDRMYEGQALGIICRISRMIFAWASHCKVSLLKGSLNKKERHSVHGNIIETVRHRDCQE